MIDAGMKRRMKWHMEGYIDTDIPVALEVKEALENMDRDSLKRMLNTSYGLSPVIDRVLKTLIWKELQRRNKEEKKMEDKKYYSGSVMVTTWRTRNTISDLDDVIVTLNNRTDRITFKDGYFMGVTLYPKIELPTGMPIDARKRYTKEEITEAIINAWDKGEYAEDQTDISWIFNPDPEGFTGTVDLATVLLKDRCGYRGSFDAYHNPQARARCRVRIVDGKFFEKLDGSSELADIFKNYRYTFYTEENIKNYIAGKWCVRDFGKDASYYILNIEEDSDETDN